MSGINKQVQSISASTEVADSESLRQLNNRQLNNKPEDDKPEKITLRELPPKVQDYREGKKHLHVSEKRGEYFHDCASMNAEYLCCNVKVLASVSNCPYECSYCFLQNYLTDTTMSVVADVEGLTEEVRVKTSLQPWRFFRIGTWELGDSLALEPLVNTAAQQVLSFAEMDNVLLELRTKSADVDSLIGLPHKRRTVVSWTLNPQEVIRREEYRTASIEARIAAMKKVVEAGYLIALHFDPMIYYPDWQAGYEELISELFQHIAAKDIVWISIGSLRFNPEMKKIMEDNYPGSRATSTEMVLGNDGKMRYIKPLRVEMYQHLYGLLQKVMGELIDEQPFIYLCMERWDVWKRVLGWRPESTAHVDYLIAESVYRRFPGLLHQEPQLERYLDSDAKPADKIT